VNPIHTEVDRILFERRLVAVRTRVAEMLESSNLSKEDFSTLEKLHEALSDRDWDKFGTIAALLWYRIDKVIDALKEIQRAGDKSIDRQVGALATVNRSIERNQDATDKVAKSGEQSNNILLKIAKDIELVAKNTEKKGG